MQEKIKEQRINSLDELKEWRLSLNNTNGRSRTENENKLFVQEICYHMEKGNTLSQSI